MRIVSLQPSVSIMIDRLGRLDTLAGCTRYCLEAVPALRSLGIPVVQDSWSTTAEEIMALRPDLVIACVPYRNESLAAILKAGCPVLALSPRSLSDIYGDLRLLAGILDRRALGENIVAAMQSQAATIRDRTAPVTARPLVYCEEWGKPLIHSQGWVRELVEAAGGVFLGQPGAVTNAQTVAAAKPDVLVMAWCGAGIRVPLERVIEQREWESLPAVRSDRVYCIADELLNTPAPTLVDGLQALAAILHPQLFGDPSTHAGVRCIDSEAATSKIGIVEEANHQNGFAVASKSVRLVVAALILRGDEVLICQRRPDQPMALKWEFPGGKMEVGESPEQALARELDEELGVNAAIGTRVAHIRHTYRSGGAVDLQFFAVHTFQGELTNRIFHDLRWCSLRDLPSYDFLAADRSLIRDLAAGKLL